MCQLFIISIYQCVGSFCYNEQEDCVKISDSRSVWPPYFKQYQCTKVMANSNFHITIRGYRDEEYNSRDWPGKERYAGNSGQSILFCFPAVTKQTLKRNTTLKADDAFGSFSALGTIYSQISTELEFAATGPVFGYLHNKLEISSRFFGIDMLPRWHCRQDTQTSRCEFPYANYRNIGNARDE